MSSIQERLQLKRVPLDTWNVREQLCLASAVVRSGDQNWMSVSRALKTVGDPNRPADWYSQKSCAAQYGALLEHVETPKRKKRSSEGAVETPQESILKRLTQERIAEIQKNVNELNQQYQSIKTEVTELQNPSISEDRVKDVWNNIEIAKRAREREQAQRTAWLREREERRARSTQAWRPTGLPTAGSPSPSVVPPASPLLTSLLKSSPVVTTPQHISHPANVVETISPSAGAPTLSMLLDKQATASAHDNKDAAIEHIKSQLVQIEQQLKAASPSVSMVGPVSVSAPATDKVDIDDIEIKAEDVYAFSDIDIVMPPVAALHKPPVARSSEKVNVTRREDTHMLPECLRGDDSQPAPDQALHVIHRSEASVNLDLSHKEQEDVQGDAEAFVETPADGGVRLSFPEVKFPTPEIKVIQPNAPVVRPDVKEPDPVGEEIALEQEIEDSKEDLRALPRITPTPDSEPQDSRLPEEQTPTTLEDLIITQDIPLPPDPAPDASEPNGAPEVGSAPVEIKHEVEEGDDEEAAEEKSEEEPPSEQTDAEDEAKLADDDEEVKNKDDADKVDDYVETSPKVELKEEPQLMVRERHPEAKESEDNHTETDDDTPMELSREEEKDGKKKRDYSRKKKSDSRTWSGSESAPESPAASSDTDRNHKLWKRSVMLVHSRLCAHKYASLFLRPITDEQAPGYSLAIKRPMDLSTIKKNIDGGTIRTTAEFQRDVLLMLSNALMYNSTSHRVYQMAKEMHQEAEAQLGMLLQAQAHSGLSASNQPRAPKRRSNQAAPNPGSVKRRHD